MLLIHVAGATVWVGGHLLLSLRYLPEALRLGNPDIIKTFEKKYEAIGMPALLLQVVTGLYISLQQYQVSLFGLNNGVEKAVTLKLSLLLITVLLALNVRFFIFPKLSADNLKWLAFHIVLVTLISLIMLFLGVSIRFGGIR